MLLAISTLSALLLTGCTELQNIGKSAKDGAVMRAQMEASVKASEAVGKIAGSKY